MARIPVGMRRPREQGFTVFFTGLSGAGKSTIAEILQTELSKMSARRVTLLDGDYLRKHLSSDLGFSKHDRDTNVRRAGHLASEITRKGEIVVCALIAPYDSARKQVRDMIEPYGGFVLVHVNTPLRICEQRDPKGLYAKARAGLIKDFTGVSDPYEPPQDATVIIDTTNLSPEESAHKILLCLQRLGYVPRKHNNFRRPQFELVNGQDAKVFRFKW